MCNYTSVLIFYALIFLTHISKGNGLKCYQCSANSKDLDPASKNCWDGNENAPIKEYTPDIEKYLIVACGMYKFPLKDGSFNLTRFGDYITKDLASKAVKNCEKIRGMHGAGSECNLCFKDFCNGQTSRQNNIAENSLLCFECKAYSLADDSESINCFDGNEKILTDLPIKKYTPLSEKTRTGCAIFRRRLGDGSEVRRMGFNDMPSYIKTEDYCNEVKAQKNAPEDLYCDFCDTDLCNGHQTSRQNYTDHKAGEMSAGVLGWIMYKNAHKNIVSTPKPLPNP